MIMKILIIVCGILAAIHVLNILIHLFLLRRRNYAAVPKAGYDESYEYMDWSDGNES